jgi:hypothetical protein
MKISSNIGKVKGEGRTTIGFGQGGEKRLSSCQKLIINKKNHPMLICKALS